MATRRRRAIRVAVVAGALLAADLTWALLVYPRPVAERVVTVAQAPRRDVVVLGAGVDDDGEPSRVLRDRLRVALALHRAGKARSILVSGDASASSNDETGTMRAWLVARGVPRSAIHVDPHGVRTYETMRRAKRVYRLDEVIVVTSDFHLARAMRLARAVGLDVVGCAAATRYRSFATRVRFWLREVVSRHRALLDEREA